MPISDDSEKMAPEGTIHEKEACDCLNIALTTGELVVQYVGHTKQTRS